ncbi:MAG: PepSY domain-containing protein [Colwellia sp.]
MKAHKKLKKSKRLSSKLHKVLSLFFIPVLLFIAVSGIGLNHPSIIKNLSLPISSLPENYHFKQWNRGLIQTIVEDEKGGKYAAGKNGLGYFINGTYQQIDNPLATNNWQNFIYSLYYDEENEQLFIGSRDGLFRYQILTQRWHYYLETSEQRIVSIVKSNQAKAIIVIANHQIFTIDLADSNNTKKAITTLDISLAESSQATPLFRFIFALHSGEILGLAGVLLMDLTALSLIYFCLSGVYYWLFPKVVRRKLLNKKRQIKGARVFRWLARHHNNWELVLAPLLIISALTAVVMRPPGLLLIVSSNSPVVLYPNHASEKIPYKITKAVFIENKLLLLTNDGIFSGQLKDKTFEQIQFSVPVHGMGATIFKQQADGHILVGSFSGLFSWDNKTDQYKKIALPDNIAGLLPVAAYQGKTELIVFDFFKGILFDKSSQFSLMPNSINNTAEIALWNFFFELHNLRIFEHYIGAFYLLLLLVLALSLLIITITGVILHCRKAKKKRS